MISSFQSDIFQIIWSGIAADGRDALLFGNAEKRVKQAFEDALLPGQFPAIYLEFPLSGEPSCDMTLLRRDYHMDGFSDPDAPFGAGRMFRWFAALEGEKHCCGLEMDIGRSGPVRAAMFLRFDKRTEQLAPFLDAAGNPGRLAAVEKLIRMLPEGWSCYYAGLFAGREGAPLRLGVEIDPAEAEQLREDPALWAEHFRAIGFSAFSDQVTGLLSRSILPGCRTEIGLDLMPDGSLGDALGLCVIAGRKRIRDTDFIRMGPGAAKMAEMESGGLIDGRWKALAGCCFHFGLPLNRPEESGNVLALAVGFHSFKLKFRAGKLSCVKGYLEAFSTIV